MKKTVSLLGALVLAGSMNMFACTAASADEHELQLDSLVAFHCGPGDWKYDRRCPPPPPPHHHHGPRCAPGDWKFDRRCPPPPPPRHHHGPRCAPGDWKYDRRCPPPPPPPRRY